MADAAASVVRSFNGNMVFINTLQNISERCDCVGSPVTPCMRDIGIGNKYLFNFLAASTDPVAVDQSCIDLILGAPDSGRKKIIDIINRLHGYRTLKRAEEHGLGTRQYNLVVLQ
ncbi:MAG: hypothetical protein MJ252_14825 [archaeon]|nr:hypothetical protein [archaeon]